MKRGARVSVAVVVAVGGAIAAGAAQGEQAKTGLDSLPESRLQAELSARGLPTLLNAAFDQAKVPGGGAESAGGGQRETINSLNALRELSDPAVKRTPRERDELIRRAVAGVKTALPTMNDPRLLMEQAGQLVRQGMARDVSILEYWGPNATTMARLRPVAEAAVALYDRAAAVAHQQADAIANKLTSPTDPAVSRYEELARLASTAEFQARSSDYALALSIDPISPERKVVASRALEALAQYDSADSGVQTPVRIMRGKLNLAAGAAEVGLPLLESIGAAKDIAPAPTVGQQFEAAYFAAIAKIDLRAAADAEARLQGPGGLKEFVQKQFPAGTAEAKGCEAALSMLRYRILVAQKKGPEANAALLQLVKQRPDLQSIIYEQLVSTLAEDVDLTKQEPLLLRALVQRAEAERLKPESAVVDEKTVQRGIAAARELMGRGREAGGAIDPETRDSAAIVLPTLLELVGQKQAAAAAYLDYATAPGNVANAEAALDAAGTLIQGMRKEDPESREVGALLDRFYALAVNAPYGRARLAYAYARRLQATGQFEKAIDVYGLVPKSDANALQGRFFRLLAMKQRLDEARARGGVNQAWAPELLAEAGRVQAEARSVVAGTAGGSSLKTANTILVRTSLLLADLARTEQKNPAAAIAALEGFEQAAAGLDGAAQLMNQAETSRVQALIELERFNEATDKVIALLQKTGGGDGAEFVYKLLSKNDSEFQEARRKGDTARMGGLARSRAALSGFLVKWAKENRDPKIQASARRYELFDAESKRLAAEFAEDPAERMKGREAALALYQGLLDPAATEPAAEFGVALVQFDLGNFKVSQQLLGKLLAGRQLGDPVIVAEENGVETTVTNPRYWEATYKLLRSTVEMAKLGEASTEALTSTRDGLKQMLARYGREIGGPEWAPAFEKLRAEIAPDYQIPELK